MISVVLKAPGPEAVGFIIRRIAWDYHNLHGFGRGREGGGWVQSHKKCTGPSSFSWLWKLAGGGRLASESYEMHETVINFMVLEVGGRGAVDFRIIRKTLDNHYFHGFGRGQLASESWEMQRTVNIFMVLEVDGRGGGWPQNHKKCKRLLSFSWFWKCLRRGCCLHNHKKCIGLLSFSWF